RQRARSHRPESRVHVLDLEHLHRRPHRRPDRWRSLCAGDDAPGARRRGVRPARRGGDRGDGSRRRRERAHRLLEGEGLRHSRLTSLRIPGYPADTGVVKGVLVTSIVALALAPAAFARPLLGVAGDSDRFSSLTGQRSSTAHMYLGWGQGQTWGSSFDRVFPKLGTAPLVTITTFRWPSKTTVLTP